MSSDTLLVAGDGLIGKAVAWMAASHGLNVVIAGDGGLKASDAAAGMLAPSFEALHKRAVTALVPILFDALEAWDEFARRLEAQSGMVLDYHRNGIVGVGIDGAHIPKAKETAPPPGFCSRQAVLVPGEGQVDPRRVGAALDIVLEALRVPRVRGHATAWHDAEGGALLVDIGKRCVLASRIVLATGHVPLPSAMSLPTVDGVRGRAFLLDMPGFPNSHVIRTENIYFCPKAGNQIYLGATEEPLMGADGADRLLIEAAMDIYPALSEARIIGTFDGVRPTSVSGVPQIGPIDHDPRIILARGHDRNGVLMTPYTAQKVAAILCG